MLRKSISNYLRKEYFYLLFFIIAVVISIQRFVLPDVMFWGQMHTHYNNYLIFKQSFFHLIHHQDLYIQYQLEYGDFFKYSPTFALFFAPFSCLPDIAGLILWNSLNCLVLVYAIMKINLSSKLSGFWILFAIMIELITSTQSCQSNALIAGLIILSYSLIKEQKYFAAATLISLGAFIKIYCAVGFLFFFFADKKLRFFIASILSMLLLFFIPVVFIGFDSLIWQYKNWGQLLKWDMNESVGMSIYGIINIFTDVNFMKIYIQVISVLLLLIPLFFISLKDSKQQINYLGYLLIWLVLFNHKAESPTFIIAFTGVSIWFFAGVKNKITILMYGVIFLFCCLSPTDLFPKSVREVFVQYHVKAWPFVILFFLLFLAFLKRGSFDNNSLKKL